MATLRISYKTGQKILKYLASISTPTHAEQIRKRNQEALDKGVSFISCPHCNGCMECHDCLWTHAVKHVTKKSIGDKRAICVNVPFTPDEVLPLGNWCGICIPEGIRLYTNHLSIDSSWPAHVKWIKAHIDWTKNFKWGTKKVKGYRRTVYGR